MSQSHKKCLHCPAVPRSSMVRMFSACRLAQPLYGINEKQERYIPDIDAFVSRYVLNNPDRHIATLMVKEKEWASDERSFMTMSFTKQIHYGEHFKKTLAWSNNLLMHQIIWSSRHVCHVTKCIQHRTLTYC